MEFIKISNIVEDNGKTVKENNLEKTHKYKKGTLVEMENGVRMFISGYRRDCDGTPLYCLSYENDPWEWENNSYGCQLCGFGEDRLTPISKRR